MKLPPGRGARLQDVPQQLDPPGCAGERAALSVPVVSGLWQRDACGVCDGAAADAAFAFAFVLAFVLVLDVASPPSKAADDAFQPGRYGRTLAVLQAGGQRSFREDRRQGAAGCAEER